MCGASLSRPRTSRGELQRELLLKRRAHVAGAFAAGTTARTGPVAALLAVAWGKRRTAAGTGSLSVLTAATTTITNLAVTRRWRRTAMCARPLANLSILAATILSAGPVAIAHRRRVVLRAGTLTDLAALTAFALWTAFATWTALVLRSSLALRAAFARRSHLATLAAWAGRRTLVYAGAVAVLTARTLPTLLRAIAGRRRWRVLLRAGTIANLAALPRPALLAAGAIIAGIATVSLHVLPVAADVAVVGIAVANIVPQILPVSPKFSRLFAKFLAQFPRLRAVFAVFLDRFPQLPAVLVDLPFVSPNFLPVPANLAIVGVALPDVIPQFAPIPRDLARRRPAGRRWRRGFLRPRPRAGDQQSCQRHTNRSSANHS